jgi:hypothetical protein
MATRIVTRCRPTPNESSSTTTILGEWVLTSRLKVDWGSDGEISPGGWDARISLFS